METIQYFNSTNHDNSVAIIFGMIVFVLVIVLIVNVVLYIRKEKANDDAPIKRDYVTVIQKRQKVKGSMGGAHHGSRWKSIDYATFEFENHQHIELQIPEKVTGHLVEGDTGWLEYQGTRFIKFERETQS